MNNKFKEITPNQIEKNTFSLIGDEWMLITAQKDNKVNTMTASWGGFGVMWNKNVAYIVIRPQRYTKEFVDNSNYFSLTFFDNNFKKALGYLGSVSGKDEDKISKSGLTVDFIDNVPYFKEANLVLVCRKIFSTDYKEENFIDIDTMNNIYSSKDFHTLYIAEIEKVYSKIS